MTQDEVMAAIALAEKATAGPWGVSDDGFNVVTAAFGDVLLTQEGLKAPNVADTEFAAAARTLVPSLAGDLLAARERIGHLMDDIAVRDQAEQVQLARIARLEEELREVLSSVGPCDGSEAARGFCCHDNGSGLQRLPCPYAEARKVLEGDRNADAQDG